MKLNKQDFLDMMQDVSNNVFQGGKTTQSLKTADGSQLDFMGYPVEESYESFTGGVSVHEGKVGQNSHLLYKNDASCVGPYEFVSFHQGKYNSPEATAEYLAEKYKDVEFQMTHKMLSPANETWPRVVDNGKDHLPTLSDDKTFLYGRYDPNDMVRLVWSDQGVSKANDGKNVHQVSFARACDEMIPGKDPGVPNPYLKNMKSADGKVIHSVNLTDDLYDRLKGVSKSGSGPWSGCVEALLDTRVLPNGNKLRFPDLSDMAKDAGFLRPPEKAFDLQKHDSFVKQSMYEIHKNKQMDRQIESGLSNRIRKSNERPLPDLPTGVSVDDISFER